MNLPALLSCLTVQGESTTLELKRTTRELLEAMQKLAESIRVTTQGRLLVLSMARLAGR